MSISAAVLAVVDALETAGLRVAVRDGDLTPPCVYIKIGTTTDAGVPLTGGVLTTFYVYYVPVRGVDNLAGDAAALDQIYEALTPLTWTALAATASSVTVKNDTWPCYRLDVATVGLSPAAALKGQ